MHGGLDALDALDHRQVLSLLPHLSNLSTQDAVPLGWCQVLRILEKVQRSPVESLEALSKHGIYQNVHQKQQERQDRLSDDVGSMFQPIDTSKMVDVWNMFYILISTTLLKEVIKVQVHIACLEHNTTIPFWFVGLIFEYVRSWFSY